MALELMAWKEVLDKDFPPVKITSKTREVTVNYSSRYLCNDVRVATGRFYTDEEYEDRRKRVLSKPLP